MQAWRANWFRLLADLKRSGVSLYDVASLINVSHTTVLRWGEGSEPRHADGEALIMLWMEKTGNTRERVPRIYIYAEI